MRDRDTRVAFLKDCIDEALLVIDGMPSRLDKELQPIAFEKALAYIITWGNTTQTITPEAVEAH